MLDSMFMRDTPASHPPTTLSDYVGHYLSELERLFGQRDPTFTLLGIEIYRMPNAGPHLWFRGGQDPPKQIVIRLAPNAAPNPTLARWQLAHECVHLLDPTVIAKEGPTILLEEGLAEWFQNTYVPEAAFRAGECAQDLVEPIMEQLSEAIRKIRSSGVRLTDIDPSLLREHLPDMSKEMARTLCQRSTVQSG